MQFTNNSQTGRADAVATKAFRARQVVIAEDPLILAHPLIWNLPDQMALQHVLKATDADSLNAATLVAFCRAPSAAQHFAMRELHVPEPDRFKQS